MPDKKILSSSSPTWYGGKAKKSKKKVRAGSYDKKKRKGYEKMLSDAGKI